ncbi:MAG: diguanylate cyclase [Deltaproteobacteria bacterium]|nr:diguanylate cyclase [Deltaproteobacteria bacterium]
MEYGLPLELFDNREKLFPMLIKGVIYRLDVIAGKFEFVSYYCEELLGYSSEELLTADFGSAYTMIHPDDLPVFLNKLDYVKSRGPDAQLEVQEVSYRTSRKDREYIYVTARYFPVFGPNGILRAIIGIFQETVDQGQVEEELFIRLQYEEALANCSRLLLTSYNLEAAISHALSELLNASGTDRVYLCENVEDADGHLAMKRIHEVFSGRIDIRRMSLQPDILSYEAGFDRWRQILCRGDIIAGPVDQMPEVERRQLSMLDIISLLVIPIFVDNKFYGFIAFNECTRLREWREEDTRLLRSGADMIGSAISRKRTEDRLRHSERRYRILIEENINPIAIFRQDRLLLSNRALALLFQYDSPAAMKGLSLSEFIVPDDYSKVKSSMGVVEVGSPAVVIKTTGVKSGGQKFPMEISLADIVFDLGSVLQVIFNDITERHRVEEILRYTATHDPLTGLLNRGAILERLTAELSRAKRVRDPLAIALLDIDFFKKVNDTYGHIVGDGVLREVSRRIQTGIRKYDTVGRYGGEEFLIVVPAYKDISNKLIFERIRLSICQQEANVSGMLVPISASLGVAVYDGRMSLTAFINTADEALYRAKRKGRNLVEYAI